MPRSRTANGTKDSSASLGFEAKLWLAAELEKPSDYGSDVRWAESNATTRRLAVMNFALRGIEADFGPEHGDTFRRDLHRDIRADYVIRQDDVRWNAA